MSKIVREMEQKVLWSDHTPLWGSFSLTLFLVNIYILWRLKVKENKEMVCPIPDIHTIYFTHNVWLLIKKIRKSRENALSGDKSVEPNSDMTQMLELQERKI